MSFGNRKYLKQFRENLTEHFNLLLGRPKHRITETETLPKLPPATPMPNKNLLNGCFKTKQFPQARNYISYLRAWKKKNPPTPPEVVRERMEKEIRANKEKGKAVDLRFWRW